MGIEWTVKESQGVAALVSHPALPTDLIVWPDPFELDYSPFKICCGNERYGNVGKNDPCPYCGESVFDFRHVKTRLAILEDMLTDAVNPLETLMLAYELEQSLARLHSRYVASMKKNVGHRDEAWVREVLAWRDEEVSA